VSSSHINALCFAQLFFAMVFRENFPMHSQNMCGDHSRHLLLDVGRSMAAAVIFALGSPLFADMTKSHFNSSD
jgi:hypothetical protein